jgi:hypothetical protein
MMESLNIEVNDCPEKYQNHIFNVNVFSSQTSKEQVSMVTPKSLTFCNVNFAIFELHDVLEVFAFGHISIAQC